MIWASWKVVHSDHAPPAGNAIARRRARSPTGVSRLPSSASGPCHNSRHMVDVEMRHGEVIDVSAMRIDELHISRAPLARLKLRAREERHDATRGQARLPHRTVQQQRRAIRENEKLRLARAGMDEVDLERALRPRCCAGQPVRMPTPRRETRRVRFCTGLRNRWSPTL